MEAQDLEPVFCSLIGDGFSGFNGARKVRFSSCDASFRRVIRASGRTKGALQGGEIESEIERLMV